MKMQNPPEKEGIFGRFAREDKPGNLKLGEAY